MMRKHKAVSVDDGIMIILLDEDNTDGKKMHFACTVEEYNDGLAKYMKGYLIQDAFPFLTPDEREFLMTGITPVEWAELFMEDQ